MSDLDRAVRAAKRIESILERRFDARGRGLHEKLSSVQAELPESLIRRIRFIAAVRNKLVHEAEYNRIDDRAGFMRAAREAERHLKHLVKLRSPIKLLLWRAVVAVLVLALLLGIFAMAWKSGWLPL